MFSLDEKELDANAKEVSRMQVLIIGRLMAIFLLLLASWVWNSGHLRLSFENLPRWIFLLFLISSGLTIAYFFILRISKNVAWQVRGQFLLDALLVTWLVWRTGDLSSPYITLYIVLISVASIFLGPRGTLFFAALSALLFTVLSISTATEMLESYGNVRETTRVIQIISFHVVAFLVVGLLAARLSDRHASGAKLKETEQTLLNLQVLHQRIVESIRSGLITTDLQGEIYSFNMAAEEITGYKASEMRGQNISTLLGDIEEEIAYSLQAAIDGEQPGRSEADILTPEGFAVRIGYGISPLFSEDGKTSGLVVSFQDLTEIRSMEESVRRKDRLAAVGRVAAGLAHEIRNPLGAMRGAIQLMEGQIPANSSQSSLMEIILRESDRLNRIITNFLTYARPRINNFSETDVCESLRDTFTLLRHSPEVADNHELLGDFPLEPVLISADPAQLKQIFWNLARNAIQAMPHGGKLTVSLKKLPNTRVQILFSDTGCGMSPSQVEQLFEPFSESTTGGTGLGLSIVYQIVRDHAGTVNVRSLEGEGTTITIELPSDIRVSPVAPNEAAERNIEPASGIENLVTIEVGEN